MRRAVATFVLVCLPVVAGATEIRTYGVRVVALAEGPAAVTVTTTLDGVSDGTVTVPVGFSGLGGLDVVAAPTGTTVSVGAVNGQSSVRVVFATPPPSPVTLSFRFTTSAVFVDTTPAPGERATLPAGSRLLKHTFVNTEPLVIGEYRAEFVFPDGLRAHAIREFSPKLRKGEVGPRVRLTALDGQPGGRLQVTRLRQGDGAAMTVELVPEGRSWAFLVVGLLLSVLYLVSFKDLVGKPAA